MFGRECLVLPPNPIYLVLVFFYFQLLICSNLFSDIEDQRSCPQGLESLEIQVQKELRRLNIPSPPWVLPIHSSSSKDVLDVAIIGGGMGGLAAGFALQKEGVCSIKIFDENDSHCEGPWARYARMRTLRSGKKCLGPSCGIPSLTFFAWYEAQYGLQAWDDLKLVPTDLWSSYLCWFRSVLNLPVENKIRLEHILPVGELFELSFVKEDKQITTLVRKVVLATGREGSGGCQVPDLIQQLPSKFYAHTGQQIDFPSLKNKRIAIIGAGASAFDAAAVALETEAASVDMLIRRNKLPNINRFNQFYNPRMAHGFYSLPDKLHLAYFDESFKVGIPPPKRSLDRVVDFDNFYVHYDISIQEIICTNDSLTLCTNQGHFTVDFIIAATGYTVDLSKRPELSNLFPDILLWSHKCDQEGVTHSAKLGKFPYLGPHFEFLERKPDQAAYLKHIYCYNYGAFLSHGLLSGDIALCSLGAARLARGIVIDLFIDEHLSYFDNFMQDQPTLFNPNNYHFSE